MTPRGAAALALAGLVLGAALVASGLAWRSAGLPQLVDPACGSCLEEVDQ